MTEHDPIFTVARAMTDTEPDAALVDRVRARLAATAPAAPARHVAWRWAIPATAAAALVVTTVVLMRPSPVTDQADAALASPVASNHTAPATSPTGSGIEPAPVTSLPSARPRMARSAENAAAPTEAELAWLARSVRPLDPIPPMVIAQIVVESTQPQPLPVPPLTIMPLTMPPVNGGPDGGRPD